MSANTKFTFTDTTKHSWTDGTISEASFLIPAELADTEQWITYKKEWSEEDGKYKKKPHSTEAVDSKFGGKWVKYAGVRSEDQFVDWQDAHNFVEKTNKSDTISTNLDGYGFVFTEDDDYIGIDLDDCVDEEGHVKQFVNKFLGSVDSFAEFSQSGTGIHIIAKGSLDDDYQQRDDALGIEIYEKGRYFAITGNHIEGTSKDINEATDEIHLLQEKYMDERQESADDVDVDFGVDDDNSDGPTDDDVVRTAKAYDDDFEALHRGSNHVDDNDGANESDLAYCNKLSFWTQGNASQIERIWKKSGRSREKLKRDDYVQETIRTAIRSNPDDFTGNYR